MVFPLANPAKVNGGPDRNGRETEEAKIRRTAGPVVGRCPGGGEGCLQNDS